jgi:hypothetical protein
MPALQPQKHTRTCVRVLASRQSGALPRADRPRAAFAAPSRA